MTTHSAFMVSWWLDVSAFPDLVWARMRAFPDGSADVLDLDGRLHRFQSAQDAQHFLLEDEYEPAANIDHQDLECDGLVRGDLVPPSGTSDSEVVPQMLIRRRPSP